MPAIQPNAHTALIRQIRSAPEVRAARAQFREFAQSINDVCWLDGEPIDYDLPPEHPDSWSWDHAIPLSKGLDFAEIKALAIDPNNSRSTHLACNKRRGNADPHIDIGTPSRQW